MKRLLEGLLREALTAAVQAGELRVDVPARIQLEEPGDPAFGDLASNIAMVLARQAGRPPRAIAQVILERLQDPAGLLAGAEIAGPGFINLRASLACWRGFLAELLTAGESYGRPALGSGRRVQVEFVSANPTGPLHVGHGRGAVIGDVIARLLAAAGYEVEREYYVNDFGRQMTVLGRSVWIRARQLAGEEVALDDDAYPGDYVIDVARALRAEHPNALAGLDEPAAIDFCARFAERILLDRIKDDLARFGVRFDVFVSERALHERGVLEQALGVIPPQLLYEEGDALMFRTTEFGDEKDRAVRRSNGVPTYFGGDIAHFHETVRARFDALVNVLGADHHGYVARLRAALAALGDDPDRLRVVLVQLVNLTRGGQPVRMGKRAGEFVTLAEVLDEVGADAARFFFLLRKADSQLEFDLELAKKQSTDNPVFYVQYAHARIASVFRQAAAEGVDPGDAPDLTPIGEPELEVLRALARYPDVVETAARALEPHRLVFYLQELAGAFHRYYNQHRILADDRPTAHARLALLRAVRLVLRSALDLVGVGMPERM
ncbi:MAG TPA: arginine--tRNA ligase [Candidatus Limnocylindria bacterium]|nr:arginine--tRNA ligase [Candidatus Limnocylindria bacterium]